MKKLLGVFALSAAIPLLHAGVYNFSTLHHEGTGNTSITHDSSLADHRGDSRPTGQSLVGGDGDGVSHDVVVNAVPEPGFYGLMALGFGALAVFQVRKRRQA
jgi:hypothetical protein